MENEILERYFAGHYSLKEAPIPLSFREQSLLTVKAGELYGKAYLFVFAKEEISFSEICALDKRFQASSGLPSLFVLKGRARPVARLLMKENIPFITAVGFVFVPQVMIYGPLPAISKNESLLWHDSYIPVAQFFLLNPSVKLNSLQLQAQLPFYSRSLLTKALAFLKQFSFLKQEGAVRSTVYSLANPLGASYALIKSRFINPIRASYYVKESEASLLPRNTLSSESALAYYTDLSPLEEAYLLKREDYLSHRPLLVGASERNAQDNYFRYDLFAYAPFLVKKGSAFVLNPLDVIAIYREEKDPRVETAIERLEEAYR